MGQKEGRLAAHQIRDAVGAEEPATVGRWVGSADEPFFVTDNGTGTRGKWEHQGISQ